MDVGVDVNMGCGQVVAASGTAAIVLDGAGKVFGKRLAFFPCRIEIEDVSRFG